MLKFNILTTLIILLNLLKFSVAEDIWVAQNSGTLSSLLSVSFLNSDTGWIAGREGTLLRTFDGGETWDPINSGVTFPLRDVQFINSDTGFVVGSNGLISRTVNGGLTWIPQNSGVTSILSDIQFPNSLIGYVSGSDRTLLKTIDGGENWTLLDLNWGLGFKYITGLHFHNPDTGIFVPWLSSGRVGPIQKTVDGGETWYEANSNNVYWKERHPADIFFVNNEIGWIVGENDLDGMGIIAKTIDGGETWIGSGKTTKHQLNSSHFINPDTGWIVADYDSIIKSTDGGETWSVQYSGVSGIWFLADIEFINNTGYAVGSHGSIVKLVLSAVTFTLSENFNYNKSVYLTSFPNPFRVMTKFNIGIESSQKVSLKIYNLLGQNMATVLNKNLGKGRHVIEFYSGNLVPGIYLSRLSGNGWIKTRKLDIIK